MWPEGSSLASATVAMKALAAGKVREREDSRKTERRLEGELGAS